MKVASPRRPLTAVILGLLALAAVQGEAADRFQPSIPAAQERQLDRARTLRRTEGGAQSISVLETLVRENPDYYLARYNLALAYAESNDLPRAVTQFQEAQKLQDKYRISDPTLYNSLGWANLLRGNYVDAEAAFKKAESQFGSLPDESQRRLLNNMGVLYQYKKDYDKAETYFKRSAENHSSTLGQHSLQSNQVLQQYQQQQQQLRGR